MKACSTQQHTWKLGQLVGKSAGIIIKRLRVRIPAGTAGEFSSPELTLNADSYSVSILTHVIAVACKRPWSFCQKCRWQVMPKHAHTLDPTKSEWAEYAAVQAQCGNLSSGNKLTRNLSGNIQPQSSQLTDPLCTDPGIKSGIGVCKLVSTSKKKKKMQLGNEWQNILPKSSLARKKSLLPPPCTEYILFQHTCTTWQKNATFTMCSIWKLLAVSLFVFLITAQ